MRFSIYIFFIICCMGCKKDLNVLSNYLVNFAPDSLWVTVTNLTHKQFSIPKTGLAGWIPGAKNSVELKAVDGDELNIQCSFRYENKLARHTLFLKEVNYSYRTQAPYRGTIIAIRSIGDEVIEIKAQNSTNKFITAMLAYNGREDSLWYPVAGESGSITKRLSSLPL